MMVEQAIHFIIVLSRDNNRFCLPRPLRAPLSINDEGEIVVIIHVQHNNEWVRPHDKSFPHIHAILKQPFTRSAKTYAPVFLKISPFHTHVQKSCEHFSHAQTSSYPQNHRETPTTYMTQEGVAAYLRAYRRS